MSNMSQTLRALVTERLTAAAEEIFMLVERTLVEYEEELCRSKEENQRKQQLLDQVLCPQRGAGTGNKPEKEDKGPSLKLENMEAPCLHFQDFSPNLHPTKPDSDINFTSQDYLQPRDGESSSSDTEMTDEEPPIDNADLHHFYRQNQTECFESLIKNPSAGSSNMKQTIVRPPKQCSVCGKVFGDLKRHMVVHTREKPYSCPVCDKRFTRKGSLQSHMAVHSGDTPYRCPVCGKMFSQKGHLETHIVMHSGEKPFGCLVCGAKFSSKALLLRHMRVHTGVRPFSCPFCERGFTRNEHLRRHVQTHTGAQIIQIEPQLQS